VDQFVARRPAPPADLGAEAEGVVPGVPRDDRAGDADEHSRDGCARRPGEENAAEQAERADEDAHAPVGREAREEHDEAGEREHERVGRDRGDDCGRSSGQDGSAQAERRRTPV